MLRLAQVLAESGISRREVGDDARAAGFKLAKKTLVALLNDGTWPLMEMNRIRLREWLEGYVADHDACMCWLAARGLELPAIWDEVEGSGRYLFPANFGGRVSTGWKQYARGLELGDPFKIEPKEDVMQLNHETKKHFKLFRDPFECELRTASELFSGEEHVFLREMMLETARSSGFAAIYGEVGCGKSTIRKYVAERLKAEGIRILYPMPAEPSRITAASLLDAVIMDLSDDQPKRSLEAKSRQAVRLLQARQACGMKQVLIMEEAHLLTTGALKALKRIYEFGPGFEKLMGIILIGQPELQFTLDESRHPELREVTRRITLAEIGDLGEDMEAYLRHKVTKVGGKMDAIFAPGAVAAIGQRLNGKAYPQSVNNLAANAMNEAVGLGEPLVTAEIVLEA